MSHQEMSQDEIQQLAVLVAQSLAKGETTEKISQQLVDNGWEQDAANEFVNVVALKLASASHRQPQASAGSGVSGWVVWIGILVLINFLSWLFNWPFWVY